jgi:hypothetical protein
MLEPSLSLLGSTVALANRLNNKDAKGDGEGLSTKVPVVGQRNNNEALAHSVTRKEHFTSLRVTESICGGRREKSRGSRTDR